jgi:hypothetical protein
MVDSGLIMSEQQGQDEIKPMKWYVVHTYSGHENRAKLTLLERIKNAGLDEDFAGPPPASSIQATCSSR